MWHLERRRRRRGAVETAVVARTRVQNSRSWMKATGVGAARGARCLRAAAPEDTGGRLPPRLGPGGAPPCKSPPALARGLVRNITCYKWGACARGVVGTPLLGEGLPGCWSRANPRPRKHPPPQPPPQPLIPRVPVPPPSSPNHTSAQPATARPLTPTSARTHTDGSAHTPTGAHRAMMTAALRAPGPRNPGAPAFMLFDVFLCAAK